jgi:hypothetical protein
LTDAHKIETTRKSKTTTAHQNNNVANDRDGAKLLAATTTTAAIETVAMSALAASFALALKPRMPWVLT